MYISVSLCTLIESYVNNLIIHTGLCEYGLISAVNAIDTDACPIYSYYIRQSILHFQRTAFYITMELSKKEKRKMPV